MNNSSIRQTAPAAGAVVLLVDETPAMEARVAGGTKSKSYAVATAVNRLLAQLASGTPLDCALIGYRSLPSGQPDVGCRWDGPLAGRQFVSTAELGACPVTIEDRVRRIPAADGIGPAREERIRFPVWYVPRLGGPLSLRQTIPFVEQLIADHYRSPCPPAQAPLVVHLTGGGPQEASQVEWAGFAAPSACGTPLWLAAHLATSDRLPPLLYPSTDAHLPPGPVRLLFALASPLPDRLAAALKAEGIAVRAGARALIYNARMGDLIRLLKLVPAYAASASVEAAEDEQAAEQPGERSATPAVEARAAEAVPGHTMATVTDATAAGAAAWQPPPATGAPQAVACVLLLDRSAQRHEHGAHKPALARLQDEVNRILGAIARCGSPQIHVGLVTYGADTSGQLQVSRVLGSEGLVPADRLTQAAVRVDEVVEKVPNGIGGLVEVKRKKPVFVETQPAAPAPPAAAFQAAAEMIAQWGGEHPDRNAAAMVIHFTRGSFAPDQLEEAARRLHDTAPVTIHLYHVVATEQAHRSVSYPADGEKIDTPELAALWRLTSPLAGCSQLAGRTRAVSRGSRGVVINARFDLLLDDINVVLGKPTDGR